jgi:cyclopropane fatty-acyl-phospholipid synthase-like methyltransferase
MEKAMRVAEEPRDESLDWMGGMAGLEFARMFLRSTDARNTYLASALTQHFRPTGPLLLDVAGGSGLYACHLVEANPGLSAVVLEHPPVDALATESIAGRGLSDRVSVVAGDIFSAALPAGFDTVLMSNVIHDWDVGDVERLLVAGFDAVRPGGALVLHDAFLDRSRASYQAVAEYSALLMKFTAGRCYSLEETDRLLRRAGCRSVEVVPTVVGRDLVIARKPESEGAA